MSRSSFIHRGCLNNPRKDNPTHIKAKQRVSELLEANGYSVIEELYWPLDLGELGIRNYCLDISARMGDDWINVEIDGQSHDGLGRWQKDSLRDTHVKMSGYRVVRFNKEDVNGHKLASGNYFRLTDEEILTAVRLAK
jgi:hypothetical protein